MNNLGSFRGASEQIKQRCEAEATHLARARNGLLPGKRAQRFLPRSCQIQTWQLGSALRDPSRRGKGTMRAAAECRRGRQAKYQSYGDRSQNRGGKASVAARPW